MIHHSNYRPATGGPCGSLEGRDMLHRRKNAPVDAGKINALRNAKWNIAKIAEEMGMEQYEVKAVLRRIQRMHDAGGAEAEHELY